MRYAVIFLILSLSWFVGGCIPPSPDDVDRPCETYKDCLDGFKCDEGICVKTDFVDLCQSDIDCENGEVCEKENCRRDITECEYDTDCEFDRICNEGYCMSQTNFQTSYCDEHPEETCFPEDCMMDNDCRAGRICTSGFCMKGDECTSNDDCKGERVCRNFYCVNPETYSSYQNDDNDAG